MTRELNAQQLRIVLECIAGKADVMTQLLTAVERGCSEEEDEALMLAADSMLACSIGEGRRRYRWELPRRLLPLGALPALRHA